MNTIATKVRTKCADIAEKVSQSKAYKGAEKIAVGASTALAGVGLTAMSAFADGTLTEEISSTVAAAASVDKILENAMPFISPGIIVMCAIAGLRFGLRFLRGCSH